MKLSTLWISRKNVKGELWVWMMHISMRAPLKCLIARRTPNGGHLSESLLVSSKSGGHGRQKFDIQVSIIKLSRLSIKVKETRPFSLSLLSLTATNDIVSIIKLSRLSIKVKETGPLSLSLLSLTATNDDDRVEQANHSHCWANDLHTFQHGCIIIISVCGSCGKCLVNIVWSDVVDLQITSLRGRIVGLPSVRLSLQWSIVTLNQHILSLQTTSFLSIICTGARR